jgi:hypothetical protein
MIKQILLRNIEDIKYCQVYDIIYTYNNHSNKDVDEITLLLGQEWEDFKDIKLAISKFLSRSKHAFEISNTVDEIEESSKVEVIVKTTKTKKEVKEIIDEEDDDMRSQDEVEDDTYHLYIDDNNKLQYDYFVKSDKMEMPGAEYAFNLNRCLTNDNRNLQDEIHFLQRVKCISDIRRVCPNLLESDSSEYMKAEIWLLEKEIEKLKTKNTQIRNINIKYEADVRKYHEKMSRPKVKKAKSVKKK